MDKFRSLLNQIEEITEEDQITFFTEGLNTRTKFEVVSRNCKTLEDAITVATQYEQCITPIIGTIGLNYTGRVRHNKFKR